MFAYLNKISDRCKYLLYLLFVLQLQIYTIFILDVAYIYIILSYIFNNLEFVEIIYNLFREIQISIYIGQYKSGIKSYSLVAIRF